ncbi:RNA-directed DNA polymerase, eukaryota [Tanacetum coccineum]
MGESGKRGWIRDIIRIEQPDVIGLQETKSGVVDDLWIEDIWEGKGYGFAQLPANGNSGGIILIWDTRVFTCKEAIGDDRFVAIKGLWKGKDEEMFLVCIYGAAKKCNSIEKHPFIVRLSGLMNRWQGAWCIFKDLNVVRSSDDRINSQVNVKETNEFNGFITDMRLVEIPMGGRRFTRVSDDGLKFSKLDRFLLNDEFNNLWGNISVVALDRKLSDHCPIVLKDVELDFGPKPFRVFNIWMEEPDFIQVIEEAWKKDVRSFRPDCIFRDRLKNVKASVRVWSKERFGGHKERIKTLKIKAMRWELEAEKMIYMISRDRPMDGRLEGGGRKKKRNMADINEVQSLFWEKMEISRGCNASFVIIIPKVADPIGLGDFRPISLIGCYYKVIAKMLAKRVKRVVGGRGGDGSKSVPSMRRYILGLWNKENAKYLMCILKCFKEVSGLRVNFNKSKLYGIGVNEMELYRIWLDGGVRCQEFPFMYMSLRFREEYESFKNAWNPEVEKFQKSVADWKAKNNVVLGRLTFKVGSKDGVEFVSFVFSSIMGMIDRRKEGSVMDKGSWVNDVWCWKWEWVRNIRGIDGDGRKLKMSSSRAFKGRLPVRVELDRRGIDLDSVLCPCCNSVVESCANSLVTCDLAMSVWEKVFIWWKMGTVNALSIDEFFSSLGNVNVRSAFVRVWQAVIWTTGYFIWKERNARVFGNKVTSTNKIMQVRVSCSQKICLVCSAVCSSLFGWICNFHGSAIGNGLFNRYAGLGFCGLVPVGFRV